MEKKQKLFLGFIVIVMTVIGFSMIGCDLEEKDYEMLNGAWDRGDIVVTFKNDTAAFTQINSDSGWKGVQNNGYVKIGDKKFKNIKKNGDLQWTGQELVYDSITSVTSWDDCTITVSSNGQTMNSSSASGNSTYTKK
jgi:hypothetical protein